MNKSHLKSMQKYSFKSMETGSYPTLWTQKIIIFGVTFWSSPFYREKYTGNSQTVVGKMWPIAWIRPAKWFYPACGRSLSPAQPGCGRQPRAWHVQPVLLSQVRRCHLAQNTAPPIPTHGSWAHREL